MTARHAPSRPRSVALPTWRQLATRKEKHLNIKIPTLPVIYCHDRNHAELDAATTCKARRSNFNFQTELRIYQLFPLNIQTQRPLNALYMTPRGIFIGF